MKCQSCECNADKGMRFCKSCVRVLKGQMKASGYLTPAYSGGNTRDLSARENIAETKFGESRAQS